jgi:hypothetical protein
MNRDPVSMILAGLLLVSVTATAGLCYWYLQCTRHNQQAQAQIAQLNANRARMQSLANESAEYARRNPAIIPVLQTLGMRPRSETNSPPVNSK